VGNLYGSTQAGGSNSECTNCGVAYELSPAGGGNWNETVIYMFSGLADGLDPLGSIVLDKAGNLYGTTQGGSNSSPGTAFELSPYGSGQPWIETTLAHPSWGATGIVLGKDGNFYGTTTGNDFVVIGTIYQLTKASGNWTENVIYSFNTQTGALFPNAPILDSKLNIYFTTQESNCGGVFKLTAMPGNTWAPSQLFGFSRAHLDQGCFPRAALVFGKWGALYGTTLNGGTGTGFGNGVIFGVLP
jgi:hypothetical protein